MKVKPKRMTILQAGFEERIYVNLYPNQKWNVVVVLSDTATLTNRFVTMTISKSDYEKYFEEVEE